MEGRAYLPEKVQVDLMSVLCKLSVGEMLGNRHLETAWVKKSAELMTDLAIFT